MGMNLNLKNTAKPAAAPAEEEFVPSEHWGNVGYFDIIDGKETWVTVFGIALDNMKPIKGNGEIAARGRRARDMVMEAATSLEEGADVELVDLVFQIRRNKSKAVAGPDVESTLNRLNFGSRSA